MTWVFLDENGCKNTLRLTVTLLSSVLLLLLSLYACGPTPADLTTLDSPYHDSPYQHEDQYEDRYEEQMIPTPAADPGVSTTNSSSENTPDSE